MHLQTRYRDLENRAISNSWTLSEVEIWQLVAVDYNSGEGNVKLYHDNGRGITWEELRDGFVCDVECYVDSVIADFSMNPAPECVECVGQNE